MPTNVAEMAPEQGKIIKITLSDVSEEKPIPTAVQNRYGRSEFGGYLGNVGLDRQTTLVCVFSGRMVKAGFILARPGMDAGPKGGRARMA